ncbi:15215_t:CDS:2 [Funneliformis mosseae]|uniref:15215_t:CDS:1 n=1 Tax=Funneliformis mosseae TaxID=27381 RepID=A0A9N9CRX2_FUNMO|nr:15215_t:CDS:2 [Funneliformis mosseae]
MPLSDDIRVVVAIDFGTTYSGFAFAHKANPKVIITQDYWNGPEGEGLYKTPTVIKYDDSYENVESWGLSALTKKSKKSHRSFQTSSKPLKWFKLYLLGSALTYEKPFLPDVLDYKQVITDYLEKLGEDIKIRLKMHWNDVEFDKQVVVVLTIPAEFDDDAITIMRKCAFNAKLIPTEYSQNLKFTTEPEAAAINSMDTLKNEHKLGPGDLFMVVDCGGGTVDLTTQELLNDDELNEITVRTGDDCGSYNIDRSFIEFLGDKVGKSAMDLYEKDHYTNLQNIVQNFCQSVKLQFTENQKDFQPFQLDLEVGGFGTSKYLQSRIRQKFLEDEVPKISVPDLPIISIMRGAVKYGLTGKIKKRVLKWTYGTIAVRKWEPTDPLELKLPNGYIKVFEKLAERSHQVSTVEEVTRFFKPYSLSQQKMNIDMYITALNDAKYLRDVKLFRKWEVNLTGVDDYDDDNTITFTLKFGEMEMFATAKNKAEDVQQVTFKYNLEASLNKISGIIRSETL